MVRDIPRGRKQAAVTEIILPRLGQGACFLGEHASCAAAETDALALGVSLGMNLIDTAEMYGGGGSETLIGGLFRSRRARRSDVVLVTKVSPQNAAPPALYASCDASLARLGTDYIDLYLLHWKDENTRLADTVRGMEELVARGKILRWGVSNFDVADMEELFSLPGGDRCAADEILYHIGSRGVEYDLLPWLSARGVAAVAYCPLAQGGALGRVKGDIADDAALVSVAKKHGASVYQVMLAFVLRSGAVCAIPKAASAAHVKENAGAPSLARALDAADWAALDRSFWPPTSKMHLDSD